MREQLSKQPLTSQVAEARGSNEPRERAATLTGDRVLRRLGFGGEWLARGATVAFVVGGKLAAAALLAIVVAYWLWLLTGLR